MRRSVRKQLAGALHFLRTLRGLSFAELAVRSHLDEGYLRGVERGEREFSAGALGLLAEALDCDVTELLDQRARDLLRDLDARMREDDPMTPAPNAVRWAPFVRGPPPGPAQRCRDLLQALLWDLDDVPITPAPEAQRFPTCDPPTRKR